MVLVLTEWAGVQNSRIFNLSSLKGNINITCTMLGVVGIRELGQTNKKVESSRRRCVGTRHCEGEEALGPFTNDVS